MLVWGFLYVLFASATKRGAASGAIHQEPSSTISTPQFRRPPHNLKTDIQESHQWKLEKYGRRKPREGILFFPKPTSAGTVGNHHAAAQGSGKRCADDFDCMRVLGQVCKVNRWGTAGNCQCPDNMPVRITERGQPRCVPARLIFEDCADSAECAFLNPYVECVNQICTCAPPNTLKRKDLCIPASPPNENPKALMAFSMILLVSGILLGLSLIIARIIIEKERAHMCEYVPSSGRTRRWQEQDPPLVLLVSGIKRMCGSCQRKIECMIPSKSYRSPAVPVRTVDTPPDRPSRPPHETTVEVEVHAPYQSLKTHEALLRKGSETVSSNSNENSAASVKPDKSSSSVDTVKTVRSASSVKTASSVRSPSPSERKETPANSPASGGWSESPSDEKEPKLTTPLPVQEEEKPQDANNNQKADLDLNKDLDQLMKIVLEQLAAAKMLKGCADIDDDEGQKKVHTGGQVEATPIAEATLKQSTRPIYSRTLIKLRDRLQAGASRGISSIDEVSYGDSYRASDHIQQTLAGAEAEVDSPSDKGCGEARGKTFADVSTHCQILTPHSDTFSERKHGVAHDPSVFGPSHFESFKSFPGTIDAYPLIHGSLSPRRTYLLRDERPAFISDSFRSCSDTSYSRLARQNQKYRNFAPPITLPTVGPEKRDVIFSSTDFYNRTRDSLNEYLGGNLPHGSVRSAGCFSAVANEMPERSARTEEDVKDAVSREGSKKKQRVHYVDSEGSAKVKDTNALCSIPRRLLKKPTKIRIPAARDESEGCGSEEESPLLQTQKGSKKAKKFLPSVGERRGSRSVDAAQNASEDRTGPSPEVKSQKSTSRLLSQSSMHSWSRSRRDVRGKGDVVLVPVDDRVELCSSGPSSEMKEGVSLSTSVAEPPGPKGGLFVDPTSSSTSSGVQTPAMFLMKASQASKSDNDQRDRRGGENEPSPPQPEPKREDAKFTVTDDEIIQCINRVVDACRSPVPDDRRKFPETSAIQQPLPGSSLMKDKLLNEDIVLSSESSRGGYDSKVTFPHFSKHVGALNRPLSSLRRGDLKNIIKEILEEEYSQILQLSTPQGRAAVSSQSCQAPPVSYESQDRPAIVHDDGLPSAHPRPRKNSTVESTRSSEPGKCVQRIASSNRTVASSTEQPSVTTSQRSSATRRQSSARRSSGTSGSGETSGDTGTSPDGTSARETTVASSRRLSTGVSSRDTNAQTGASSSSQGDGSESASSSSKGATATTVDTAALTTTKAEESSTEGLQSYPYSDSAKDRHVRDASFHRYPVPKLVSSGQIAAVSETGTVQSPLRPQYTLCGPVRPPCLQHYEPPGVIWSPGDNKARPGEHRTTYAGTRPGYTPQPSFRVPTFRESESQDTNMTPETKREIRTKWIFPRYEGYLIPRPDDSSNRYMDERVPSTAAITFLRRSKSDTGIHTDDETPIPSITYVPHPRPKSASFHGTSDRHEFCAERRHTLIPRAKSYTEYWLRTVSPFKDVNTSQLSPSTESPSGIMETGSMSQLFYGTESKAMNPPRLEEAEVEALTQEENEVNPLLKTFLYMQQSVYPPSLTPTQNTMKSYTYESYDVKGACAPMWPNAPRFAPHERRLSERRGVVPFKRDNVGDKTLSHKSYSLQSSADYCIVADEDAQQYQTLTDATVILEYEEDDELSAEARADQEADGHLPVFSTNTMDDQGNLGDESSEGSFWDGRPLKKIFRRTAPYRTPFPLCSSSCSTPAVRQGLKGFVHPRETRRGPSSTDYATPSVTHIPFTGRQTRSHFNLVPESEQGSLKRGVSALSYLDRNQLWNQNALPFEHWLSAATRASLRAVEGDGASTHDASRRSSSIPDDAEQTESSEYYEAA